MITLTPLLTVTRFDNPNTFTHGNPRVRVNPNTFTHGNPRVRVNPYSFTHGNPGLGLTLTPLLTVTPFGVNPYTFTHGNPRVRGRVRVRVRVMDRGYRQNDEMRNAR